MYSSPRLWIAPNDAVCSPLAIALAALVATASLAQDRGLLAQLEGYLTADVTVVLIANA